MKNEIEGEKRKPTTDFLPSGGSSCVPSSLTPETDGQTRHSWVWDTHAMDYRPGGIVVDADISRKLERERNSARDAAKHAECYMRHHHGCRTQAPLSETTAERCDCGLIETWREVRKGILSENDQEEQRR